MDKIAQLQEMIDQSHRIVFSVGQEFPRSQIFQIFEVQTVYIVFRWGGI